jgi:outer membrane protein TolC
MALQSLIEQTLARSKAIGAVRLLTDAARDDLNETRALRWPTASLTLSEQGVSNTLNGANAGKGGQASASLSSSVTVYDFGRTTKLIDWRKELAEVALQGQRSAEEQLALTAVNLALDRARYTLQIQVYSQYVRKMSCLVDALEIITKADRGRASELVQAQKSYQQADLSLSQTQSALRQTEVRMRRLVGEPLPPPVGMTPVLSLVPPLDDLQRDILDAADIAAANANARAQRNFTESVQAGQRPSVALTGNATKLAGVSKANEVSAGVQVSIPLLQPGADAQLSAAVKRYQSTLLQRDEAIEAKRYRLLEMYEVANDTVDRARRIVEILRNSDHLRLATLQQWQQIGRRSLFDVMATEGDYYSMRVAHVNAMFDAQQVVALIWSMGRGVATPLR